MKAVQAWLLRFSESGWWLAGLTVGLVLTWFLLTDFGHRFEATTGGFSPFDMQNELNATLILSQLTIYTDAARQAYIPFTLVDYVFPLVGSVWLLALAALAVRRSAPSLHDALAARYAYFIFFIPTVFDWLENIVTVMVMWLYPTFWTWLAQALVLSKQAKLWTLGFMQWSVGLVCLYALMVSVTNYARARLRL